MSVCPIVACKRLIPPKILHIVSSGLKKKEEEESVSSGLKEKEEEEKKETVVKKRPFAL